MKIQYMENSAQKLREYILRFDYGSTCMMRAFYNHVGLVNPTYSLLEIINGARCRVVNSLLAPCLLRNIAHHCNFLHLELPMRPCSWSWISYQSNSIAFFLFHYLWNMSVALFRSDPPLTTSKEPYGAGTDITSLSIRWIWLSHRSSEHISCIDLERGVCLCCTVSPLPSLRTGLGCCCVYMYVLNC
jgi:hypothetical protein